VVDLLISRRFTHNKSTRNPFTEIDAAFLAAITAIFIRSTQIKKLIYVFNRAIRLECSYTHSLVAQMAYDGKIVSNLLFVRMKLK
jgi:hypothetical protein